MDEDERSELESYKHNADHALNLAIEEDRKLREQVSALRHEIDLRVEQGQALNQDKDHFKGNTLKAAFAELRAVNERLVQDVKRHMEREDALRLALEEAAQSLRTIEQKAGKDEFLTDIFDVRGYAYSRASAARAALEATK